MEQFSLEKYLANPSRKVVTRDGRNVRIVSTDMRCANYPIVALVKLSDNTTEDVWTYTKDGEFQVDESTDFDLFFAPEKHEGWVNIYRGLNGDYHSGGYIYDSEEEARENRENEAIATSKIEWEE